MWGQRTWERSWWDEQLFLVPLNLVLSDPSSLSSDHVAGGPTAHCVFTPQVPSPATHVVSGATVDISDITCTEVGVYSNFCCAGRSQVSVDRCVPPMWGQRKCGDGPNSSCTHTVSRHLGTTRLPTTLSETETPVGRHFRLSGHNPNSDLIMIPIEKIEDNFVRKAKESFHIKKFKLLKFKDISEIKHGLNLSVGQTN